jgi:hypothetical protein
MIIFCEGRKQPQEAKKFLITHFQQLAEWSSLLSEQVHDFKLAAIHFEMVSFFLALHALVDRGLRADAIVVLSVAFEPFDADGDKKLLVVRLHHAAQVDHIVDFLCIDPVQLVQFLLEHVQLFGHEAGLFFRGLGHGKGTTVQLFACILLSGGLQFFDATFEVIDDGELGFDSRGQNPLFECCLFHNDTGRKYLRM